MEIPGKDLKKLINRFLDRLLEHYGTPAKKKSLSPLDELVLTILSQNTNDTNRDRAYLSLRGRYHTWNDVADADPAGIEDAIRVGGLAGNKSRNIHRILNELRDRRGSIDLDYLRSLDQEAAMRELVSMKGVGIKTAACVLVFSLGMPRFPVDTHIHRIVRRWGVVPRGISREGAQDIMEDIVSDEQKYDGHLLIIEHGRKICKAGSPRCLECPLEGLCPRVGVAGEEARNGE